MSSSGFGAAWFNSTNAICKRYCVGSTPTPAIAYIHCCKIVLMFYNGKILAKGGIYSTTVDSSINDG